ncbi:MAG: hypothetical protein JST16_12490 [Bdellovibrionales bacterium]|nr:hypothetical protein [Bdellovibrionales bacterium]
MWNVFLKFFAVLCLFGLLRGRESFATPQSIRVDGAVYDAAGLPVTGTHSMVVRAYDAATGGSLLWTSSTYSSVILGAGGKFTINLDATTGSPNLVQQMAASASSGGVYFEISYDTNTVKPRIRAKGTVFALSAGSLHGVTVSAVEMNYLSGVTAALQTQINNLGSATNKVSKTGDSMSGSLQVGGTVQANTISLANQGELRLYESTGSGTNYLGLKAPATLAGDLSWIMPDVDGGNGQVMKFNATTKTFYWANDAGASGSIPGPGTSTLTAIPRWAATDGSQLSNSGITIDGSDNLAGAASVTSTGLISGLNLRATSATASRFAFLDSSKNVTSSAFAVTDTEFGYLSGATSNIQTQINSINTTTTGISGKVAKTGDSMSGALQVGAAITSTGVVTGSGVNVTGATASRIALFDGSKNVVSSAFSTTDTELGYLSGVTAALQTQINNINSSGISGKVSKTGDSMSGALQVGAAITSTGVVTGSGVNVTGATASRIALFDGSKNVVSSAFSTTDTELGYLSGVTAALQTQINSINTTTAGISGKVAKTGDSMSGALQVGAAITSTGTVTAATLNATSLTANRVIATDSSKNLAASSVTDTELGYLSGATGAVQTQLNAKLALAGGTMTGNLALAAAPTNSLDAATKAYVDAAGGGVNDFQYVRSYLTGVTTTWTAPAGVTRIKVEVCGGGGSGGGTASGCTYGAGGGGGGSMAWAYYTVTPGNSYSVIVGSGGAAPSAAGAGTVGTSGGSSSFDGAVIAGGGVGGSKELVGGAGGTPSGSVNFYGQPGNPGTTVSYANYFGFHGGSSPCGGAGGSPGVMYPVNINGTAGGSPGGGGGGSGCYGAGAPGAGGTGRVTIWY